MHKSALTFGLLASSIVMLVILPFLNQNNSFSNVMAQEYDKYGDSSYSQYPTDDKKYECRTGSFEGFFVSSVEFCKHVKFDYNKRDHRDNNQTGTQGPPGPQGPAGLNGTNGVKGINGTLGPQGIQGIQGPPGITQLKNGTNVYLVQDTTGGNGSSVFTGIAQCDQGDFVLNGGVSYGGLVTDSTFVAQNQPLTFPIPVISGVPGEAWIASIFGVDPNPINQFTVVAYCFDNPPLR